MARPSEISCEQIIEKARILIELEGYEKFSMRMLATKCNVAVSTLYLHFKNKLEIIIVVVERFWEECFMGLDISRSKDFFEAIKKAYFHIINHLEKFKISWLNTFSTMSLSDKTQSRKAMEEYIIKIQATILKQIEKFGDDFDSDFYNSIDKDYLAQFIYNNIKEMLMRCSHNYDSFEVILKRVLLI